MTDANETPDENPVTATWALQRSSNLKHAGEDIWRFEMRLTSKYTEPSLDEVAAATTKVFDQAFRQQLDVEIGQAEPSEEILLCTTEETEIMIDRDAFIALVAEGEFPVKFEPGWREKFGAHIFDELLPRLIGGEP